jgi:hypothetical protein
MTVAAASCLGNELVSARGSTIVLAHHHVRWERIHCLRSIQVWWLLLLTLHHWLGLRGSRLRRWLIVESARRMMETACSCCVHHLRALSLKMAERWRSHIHSLEGDTLWLKFSPDIRIISHWAWPSHKWLLLHHRIKDWSRLEAIDTQILMSGFQNWSLGSLRTKGLRELWVLGLMDTHRICSR